MLNRIVRIKCLKIGIFILFCSSGSGSTIVARFKAKRLKPLRPLMAPRLDTKCMVWIVAIASVLWCCPFEPQLLFIRRLSVDRGCKNSHDVPRELALRSCFRGYVDSFVQVFAFVFFGGPSVVGGVCMRSFSLNVCCIHGGVYPMTGNWCWLSGCLAYMNAYVFRLALTD